MKKSWCINTLSILAVALAFAGATACFSPPPKAAQPAVAMPDSLHAFPDTMVAKPAPPDSTVGAMLGEKTRPTENKAPTPAATRGAGGAQGKSSQTTRSGSGGKTDGKVIVPPPTSNTGTGKSVKHHSPNDHQLDSLKKAKLKVKRKE